MAILNMVYGGGGSSIKIPLDAISDLAAAKGNAKATITWTDPNDKTYDGITLVAWSKTILVRKVGSAPTSASDGTVVLTSTVKNQYSSTGYEDTGLTNGTTYYYAAFAIGDNGTSVISNTPSVKPVAYQTYTITWNETSDPSQFFVSYSDDATGMTQGSSDFDTFFGYYGCRLSSAGVETATVAQSSPGVLNISSLGTLTSGDNVMIKFPVRGIKMTKSGSVVTLSITEQLGREAEGYQYYAHCTGTLSNPGTPKDAFYVGVYKGYVDNNVLKSWSGKTITRFLSQSAFCTDAIANGSGYNIIGFYQRQFINCLYMMKYGNPNCQSVIGAGYTNGSSIANTGGTNGQTSATYGTSSATVQAKLFGLEDYWGNGNERLGGVYTDGSKNLYTKLSGFNGAVSGGESTGSTVGTTSGNDISSIVGNNKALFAPNATVNNGSYNTYYCDDTTINANAIGTTSGHWINNGVAGVFRMAIDITNTSYNDSTIGARLMYI